MSFEILKIKTYNKLTIKELCEKIKSKDYAVYSSVDQYINFLNIVFEDDKTNSHHRVIELLSVMNSRLNRNTNLLNKLFYFRYMIDTYLTNSHKFEAESAKIVEDYIIETCNILRLGNGVFNIEDLKYSDITFNNDRVNFAYRLLKECVLVNEDPVKVKSLILELNLSSENFNKTLGESELYNSDPKLLDNLMHFFSKENIDNPDVYEKVINVVVNQLKDLPDEVYNARIIESFYFFEEKYTESNIERIFYLLKSKLRINSESELINLYEYYMEDNSNYISNKITNEIIEWINNNFKEIREYDLDQYAEFIHSFCRFEDININSKGINEEKAASIFKDKELIEDVKRIEKIFEF